MSPPLPPENDEDEKNPIRNPLDTDADKLPLPENPKPDKPGEKPQWEKELQKGPTKKK